MLMRRRLVWRIPRALSAEGRCGDNAGVFTVTLKASGRRFAAAPGETVLEAAQRAGIALPYACRGDACGGCSAELVEGRVAYPQEGGDEVSAPGQAIQLCRAVPRSDLLIAAGEAVEVANLTRRQLDVVVHERHALAPDVVGVRLLPAEGERPLHWLPGQYLEVVLEDGRRRPFSIANGPQADGAIELHVRHVAGGGFTAWLYEHLKPGDRLRIEAPIGTFVAREDSQRPMVFVAGGTGFAPVKAVVEHFLALATRRPIRVYWGARGAADLYLRALAEDWARRAHDLRFEAVLSDPDEAGRAGLRAGLVHEAVLADLPDLSGHDVYMSGPPAMIDAGRALFAAAGLPAERLYSDSFDYAPEVLAAILARSGGAGTRSE
jgi:CDP-4-dehydro-6-deoxyglucose reductase